MLYVKLEKVISGLIFATVVGTVIGFIGGYGSGKTDGYRERIHDETARKAVEKESSNE